MQLKNLLALKWYRKEFEWEFFTAQLRNDLFGNITIDRLAELNDNICYYCMEHFLRWNNG